MKYSCECGCGVQIEKRIAASDACRMRIKRALLVRNTNTSVRETNTLVRKENNTVRESNSTTTNRAPQYYKLVRECTRCERDYEQGTGTTTLCPSCASKG